MKRALVAPILILLAFGLTAAWAGPPAKDFVKHAVVKHAARASAPCLEVRAASGKVLMRSCVVKAHSPGPRASDGGPGARGPFGVSVFDAAIITRDRSPVRPELASPSVIGSRGCHGPPAPQFYIAATPGPTSFTDRVFATGFTQRGPPRRAGA